MPFDIDFADSGSDVRVIQAELTGFKLPMTAKGWLQPYHAAGDYTPAYEDFYFHVSPGDAPPRSRGEPLGWGFPALFQVSECRGLGVNYRIGNRRRVLRLPSRTGFFQRPVPDRVSLGE